MTAVLAAAVDRLRETVAAAGQMPAAERSAAVRRALAGPVHEALMRARADGDDRVPGALDDLVAALREHVPEGTEDRLPTRVRVLIRLLRRGALEPAWMLAHDNGSGLVKPSRAAPTWAGGTFLTSALPLPTCTERGHVFAWLPGFRDPRWEVPDEVYAMDAGVVLRHRLDEVRVDGSVLVLSGIGYLSQLATGPEDAVAVSFAGPAAARHRIRARRARRPDLVSSQGPELTRLAWGGWRATVPLGRFAGAPGAWRASIEVAVDGVRRARPLGVDRGPLAEPGRSDVRVCGVRGATIRCTGGRNGRLLLQVTRP